MTGAGRVQIFSRAVVPRVLPSLFGIAFYRRDENMRSSLVLGFVRAGGLGFELLTAMNLFQYRTVSLLLLVIFVLDPGRTVVGRTDLRCSAACWLLYGEMGFVVVGGLVTGL